MNMNDIRMVIPFADPIYYRNLESSEPQGIVIISINFFTIQDSINVNKVKIESCCIIGFLNYCCLLYTSDAADE